MQYIPTCSYQDIVNNNGKIPDDIAERVHNTGCFVIKGVIDPEEVLACKKEIQDYWYGNEERTGNKVRAVQNAKGLTKLRQHPDLVKCMAAANALWHDPSGNTEWVADKPMMYVDGCRIRLAGQPGGMPAHVDSGTINRCLKLNWTTEVDLIYTVYFRWYRSLAPSGLSPVL
jgi:hypothetical protein